MAFYTGSKKYWIVPQESLDPDAFQLGHVLKRPDDVFDILNKHDVEPIDASYIINECEIVSKSFKEAISNVFRVKLEVAPVIASIIGRNPNFDIEWARASGDSFEATKVRARHVVPTEEYVNRALRRQKILDYVRKSFFTAPVYMVVGVSVASSVKRKYIPYGDAGSGQQGSGMKISANLSTHRMVQSEKKDAVEEDVVLAYRLRRFRYSKRRDHFDRKKEDESKHARYGLGEEDTSSDQDEEDSYVAQFSYFADEDVDAADVGMAGFVEDHDGEEDSSSDG